MATVNGKNVTFLIYDNGGWRMYACARSCSLTTSISTIETSTTGSGKWASFEPQKNGWTGSIDGVVNLDKPNMLTLPDLRQRQMSHTKLLIRYERVDESGNVYTDEGWAIITSATDTGSIDDVATFSIEVQGTGALTQIFTPTQFELSAVRRYEFTASGYETGFTEPLLAGKDILFVDKDGIGNSKIITSGSPASKEVLYGTADGSFTWAMEFEPGEEAVVLYQDIL